MSFIGPVGEKTLSFFYALNKPLAMTGVCALVLGAAGTPYVIVAAGVALLAAAIFDAVNKMARGSYRVPIEALLNAQTSHQSDLSAAEELGRALKIEIHNLEGELLRVRSALDEAERERDQAFAENARLLEELAELKTPVGIKDL